MTAETFIIADWGSTNIRAFLYLDGKEAERRDSSEGITKVQGRDCEAVFDKLTGAWFKEHGPLPVTLAGMVGSVNGWVDAPYLDCPADLSALASRLCPVTHSKGYDIRVIPGICVRDSANYNVMRGEETQLAGSLRLAPADIYVMPGTHCKWVYMDGSRVQTFRTAMTGELHATLLKNTLVGFGLPEQKKSAPETFKRGLQEGRDRALLPLLFEIRAARILGGVDPAEVSEYLSGVLIGNEIASLGSVAQGQKIGIVANNALAHRYAEAFKEVGIEVSLIDGEQAFREGIVPIARERA